MMLLKKNIRKLRMAVVKPLNVRCYSVEVDVLKELMCSRLSFKSMMMTVLRERRLALFRKQNKKSVMMRQKRHCPGLYAESTFILCVFGKIWLRPYHCKNNAKYYCTFIFVILYTKFNSWRYFEMNSVINSQLVIIYEFVNLLFAAWSQY